MIILIVRIVLTALAAGFLGWLGYVIYLGLQSFFGKKNCDLDSEHRKRRGGTWPSK